MSHLLRKKQENPDSHTDRFQGAMDLINLLNQSNMCPQSLYSKLICYKLCNNETMKQWFRLKAEQVLARINKKQSITTLIKSIKQSQVLLRSSRQNIKEKPIQTQNYALFQAEIVKLMSKMGTICKKDQRQIIKINGYQLSQNLISLLIQQNRVQMKYRLLYIAIQAYQIDDRGLCQLIGKGGIQQFQQHEIQIFQRFDQQIKNKSFFNRKNWVNQEKLEQVLNQIKRNPQITVSQLKQIYCDILVLNTFFINVKQKFLLENILQMLTFDNFDQMTDALDKIQYLQPKTKKNLNKISTRLSDLLKIKSMLNDAGFALIQDKAAITYILNYMKKVSNLLQSSLRSIQGEDQYQRRKIMQKFMYSNNISNDNTKYKEIDIFNLYEYFQRLVDHLSINNIKTQSYNYNNGNINIKKVGKFNEPYQQQCGEYQVMINKVCKQFKNRGTMIKQLQKHIQTNNKELAEYKNRIQDLNKQIKGFSQSKHQNVQEHQIIKQAQKQVGVKSIIEDNYYQEQKQQIYNKLVIQKKDKQVQCDLQQAKQHKIQVQKQESINYKLKQQQLNHQRQKIITEYNAIMSKMDNDHQKLKYDWQIQRNSINKEIESLKIRNKVLQSQNIQTKNKKLQINQFLENQQQRIIEITQNLNKQKSEKQYLESKLKNYQNQSIIKNSKIDDLSSQNQILLLKIKQLQQKQPKVAQKQISAYRGQFFGDIFDESYLSGQSKPKPIVNLMQNIEKLVLKKIVKTKLIYKIDPNNKTSAHQYIDGVANWVALFKLKNNTIVGAFCQAQIAPQTMSKVGLLFNISTDKYYRLITQGKISGNVYNYNDFYFIIGNSEIRLKFGQNKIETQFGGSFKYFDTGKTKPEEFFGGEISNLQISYFQFHQVTFI